jgi:hypothetical protein
LAISLGVGGLDLTTAAILKFYRANQLNNYIKYFSNKIK